MKTEATWKTVPYGVGELDPEIIAARCSVQLVKCFVRGCRQWLAPPRRGFRGDVCPTHQIRCHVSGNTGTYSFVDPVRNIITGKRQFARNILGHPFKFESHRLGSEKSEDALTWNVFRFCYEREQLAHVVELFTGERHREEPQLFLWGISMDDFRPWSLLIEARERFETHLPVARPLTEPDIALYLPGQYLLLIEAKFTSPNTFYEHASRKSPASLTLDELIHLFWFREAKIVDPDAASEAHRVPQQLWRNMVFAEYMAQLAGNGTRAYHANLVRHSFEEQIEDEFRRLLHPEFSHHFRRQTWEELYAHTCLLPGFKELHDFMQNKTAGLRPAFQIARCQPAESVNTATHKGLFGVR